MTERVIRNPTDLDMWHPFPGYEGLYEVTIGGRVRSLARRVNSPVAGGTRVVCGREISIQSIKGYAGFTATDASGRKATVYVHRAIAALFVENRDGKPHVNHIDGDKANNDPANLEWVTHAENMRHAFDTGLTPIPATGPGEQSPSAKLTWAAVGQIRCLLADGQTHSAVAERFGVKKGTIGFIARNETWKVEP